MRVNFRKIKGFVSRHKWSFLVVMIALLGSIFAIYYSYSNNPNFNPGAVFIPKPKEKAPQTVAAPLTGLQVDPSFS